MSDDTKAVGAITNAIIEALLNRDAVLADFPRRTELQDLEDDVFYSLSIYLELCDYLEERLGRYAFLRIGRRMALAVMDSTFPPSLQTVEEAVAQINAAHEMVCKPALGGFDIIDANAAGLSVHYTAPYNCTLQEGAFYELALRYGASNATVTHAKCRRKGRDACQFDIQYATNNH